MNDLAIFFGAKFVAYFLFFLMVANILHAPKKPMLSLKAAFHRLWLGVASTLPLFLVLITFHAGPVATASIWVFRACTWFLAFAFPFSSIKPSFRSKAVVMVCGLALNLGIDLAIEAIEPPSRGGRFHPSLGWWEFGLC